MWCLMTNEKSEKFQRRRFLKSIGTAAGVVSVPGIAGATSKKEGPKGESEKRKPTKEERRLMRKKREKAEEEMWQDSKQSYRQRYEKMMSAKSDSVTTSDVIGNVPSLGCNDSYGTQEANWEDNGNNDWAQVGSFNNAYTTTSGLTNKAHTVCDAVAGDDLWARSETGIVFDTETSGRLECTASGYVKGQNFAYVPCGTGVANANLDFHLLGYNLTDDKIAEGPSGGKVIIDKFGVDLFGYPKNVNRSYNQALKLDVKANKRYVFVAKVFGSSTAVGCARGVSDADEKYDAALDPADWQGYHQMYNMGLSWNSC